MLIFSLSELESWRDSSLEVFQQYKEIAAEKGGIGLGKINGFRELVSKDLHRFDVNLDHVMRGSFHSPSQHELSLKAAADFVQSRIHSILVKILGEQYIMNALGFVLSEPGSQAQSWHVDSSHLFQPSDNVSWLVTALCHFSLFHFHFSCPLTSLLVFSLELSVLPCHFVTVFFSLVDITCLEIGPTEVALGSHLHTHVLKNGLVSDQYPAEETVSRLLSQEGVRTVKICCEAGDIGKLLNSSPCGFSILRVERHSVLTCTCVYDEL